MRKVSLLVLLGCVMFAGAVASAATRPVKKRISVVYPELAKRMHVSGTVKLQVTIGSSGSVENVKVLSGHPLLSAAASEAVKSWVFEQASSSSTEDISIDFNQ